MDQERPATPSSPEIIVAPSPLPPKNDVMLQELGRSLRYVTSEVTAHDPRNFRLPASCEWVPTSFGSVFLFNVGPREGLVYRLGTGAGYHLWTQIGEEVFPSEIPGYQHDTGFRIYIDPDRSALQRRIRTFSGFSIHELTLISAESGASQLFAAIPDR